MSSTATPSGGSGPPPRPELIRLDRAPSDWKHCLSIYSLAPSVDGDRLTNMLAACGGPLANLVLYSAPDRQWATAQFFCDSDAERFRQQCHGRMVCGRRIEVRRFVRGGGSGSASQMTPAATPLVAAHALEIPAAKAICLLYTSPSPRDS